LQPRGEHDVQAAPTPSQARRQDSAEDAEFRARLSFGTLRDPNG
jgi:hypothetical protein